MLFDIPEETPPSKPTQEKITKKKTPSTSKKSVEKTIKLVSNADSTPIPSLETIQETLNSTEGCQIKETENLLINLHKVKKLHHAIMLPHFYSFKNNIMLINLLTRIVASNGHSLDPMSIFIVKDEATSLNSNSITVANMREAINFVHKTTYSSSEKFIIVNNVSNLRKEACNSILKSLEEPPVDTYIFLLYKDISGVLDTIKSRTHQIKFFNNELNAQYISRSISLEQDCPNLKLAKQITHNNLINFYPYSKFNLQDISSKINEILHSKQSVSCSDIKIISLTPEITMHFLMFKFIEFIKNEISILYIQNISQISDNIIGVFKNTFTYHLNIEIQLLNIINMIKNLKHEQTKLATQHT